MPKTHFRDDELKKIVEDVYSRSSQVAIAATFDMWDDVLEIFEFPEDMEEHLRSLWSR